MNIDSTCLYKIKYFIILNESNAEIDILLGS